MAYFIEFSEDADRHVSQLSARDLAVVLDEIEEQLCHEPTVPTRRRKLLRENPLASWQLRVGDFRVFYNVEEERVTVVIVAIGVKQHNELTIDGRPYLL
jgi:mRNA-degrading endonuclease RelE of RelBE toxin-antitoxin system